MRWLRRAAGRGAEHSGRRGDLRKCSSVVARVEWVVKALPGLCALACLRAVSVCQVGRVYFGGGVYWEATSVKLFARPAGAKTAKHALAAR